MAWFRASRSESAEPAHVAEPAPVVPLPEPPPLPPTITGKCSTSGCSATDVYQCGYVDSRGVSCAAQLCADHVGLITPEGPVCRRHDLVAQALAATAGSLFERVRPNTEDRRYALLLLLVSEMNERMLTLLRERYADIPGADAMVDLTVRPTRRGSEVAWERGWAAFTPTGNVVRIALRVEDQEPPPVQVYVNQRMVGELVPDWILNRPQAGREQEAREVFIHRLMGLIHSSLGPTVPTQ